MRIRLSLPLLLVSSAALGVGGTCRIDPDTSTCQNTDSARFCIIVQAPIECPNTGLLEHTESHTQAPPIDLVQAVCSFESGHYRCEAWGRGPDVSYTWALNGRPGLSFVTPPFGNNEALINCQPNMTNLVYLTVTSKFGRSTTVSTNLYCGAMGEY